jgi:hypothetical protein
VDRNEASLLHVFDVNRVRIQEAASTDELKLRFRDYPEEGTLVRRRNQLALMSPA